MKRGPLRDGLGSRRDDRWRGRQHDQQSALTMSDTSKGSFVAGPGASSGVFSGRGQLLEGVEG